MMDTSCMAMRLNIILRRIATLDLLTFYDLNMIG